MTTDDHTYGYGSHRRTQRSNEFQAPGGRTMKRSINRWTMSLATVGVLALPVTSFAKASQEPPPQPTQQPQQPQTTPPPTQPQPTTSAAKSSADQTVSPQDHLRQAQEAVNAIPAT